jgi:hypothetical protein
VRIETWQARPPPYDQLQIAAGGRRFEVATLGGVAQLDDPHTNSFYTSRSRPQTAQPVGKARATKWKAGAAKAAVSGTAKGTIAAAGDSYRAKILGLLESGKLHEAGRETANGRDAIRLVSDDETVTLLVAAHTYEPIEWRLSQDSQDAVTSFPTYERLPATDTNAALLSLTKQHPLATSDENPAHYQATLERLNPKLRSVTAPNDERHPSGTPSSLAGTVSVTCRLRAVNLARRARLGACTPDTGDGLDRAPR